MDWCFLASRGASGGICLCGIEGLWRISKNMWEFMVACSFRNDDGGFSWAFARVYGPDQL